MQQIKLVKYKVLEDIPVEQWYKDDIRYADHVTISHALKYFDSIEILELPPEYASYFNLQRAKPTLEIEETENKVTQFQPKKKKRARK